jgi:hypothetical protein
MDKYALEMQAECEHADVIQPFDGFDGFHGSQMPDFRVCGTCDYFEMKDEGYHLLTHFERRMAYYDARSLQIEASE